MKYSQKLFFFLTTLIFTSQLLQSAATQNSVPENIQDGDIVKVISSDGMFLEMPQTPNTHGQYLAKFEQEKIGEKSQEFKVWTQYGRSVLIFVGAKNNSYSENYTLKGTVFMPSPSLHFGSYRILQLIPKPDSTDTYALYNEESNSYKNKTTQGGIENITSDFNSLPNSAFFTIEKVEQQAANRPEANPIIPPFNDGDFVTIRNTFGKYLQYSFNASNKTSQAQFVHPRIFMQPQILMIKRDPNNTNNIYFVGTIKNQRFQEDSNKNIIININPMDYSGQNAAVMYDPAHYSKFIVGQATPGTGSIYQLFASTKPNFFALKKISNSKFKIANQSWPLSDSDYTYNQLTNAHIFEIKKVEQSPEEIPFNDGDLVKIKSPNNLYLTWPPNLDKYGIDSARFKSNSNQPNQIFKLLKKDNYYAIIGTKNGQYTGNNAGMLNTKANHTYSATFDIGKASNPGDLNLFKLIKKTNGFFSIKTKNNQFEVITDIFLTNETVDTNSNFIIEKVERPSKNPIISGQGVSLIKLQPGFYRIKNVETNKYMTIKNQNLDSTVYKRSDGSLWNIYSLRFENAANDATQIFKIEPEGDYHKITGSLDGKYQSPNKGVFNSGFGTVYFDKVMSTDTPGYRKAKITQQAGVQGYFLTSKKDGNSRYGVDNNKLIKDKQNSRFIFEKVEAQKQAKTPTDDSGQVPIQTNSGIIKKLNSEITSMQKIIASNDTTIKGLQQQIALLKQQLSSYQKTQTSSRSRTTTGTRTATGTTTRRAKTATTRTTSRGTVGTGTYQRAATYNTRRGSRYTR